MMKRLENVLFVVKLFALIAPVAGPLRFVRFVGMYMG
jgi:hypothetical protein